MSDFEKKEITYFTKPGKHNTEKTIDIALDYAKKNNIKTILIASATGTSALELKKKSQNESIVCVTYSEAVSYEDELKEFKKNQPALEEEGIRIVKATHAFSGVDKALYKKYETMQPPLLIADILRLFSEGVKVCVESAMMAADAGLIKKKEKILALAGSGEGVDTCLLVEPSTTSDLFSFGILEIICIPKYSGLLHA